MTPKYDQKMAQNDVNGQIDKCFVELAIKNTTEIGIDKIWNFWDFFFLTSEF